jgi:hypothetical protein
MTRLTLVCADAVTYIWLRVDHSYELPDTKNPT